MTCLNSGNIIETIVKKSNSHVVRTKVGSVEVSRKMVTDDALIGYEENGGFMFGKHNHCLLYTSPSPRDLSTSRMPSSA